MANPDMARQIGRRKTLDSLALPRTIGHPPVRRRGKPGVIDLFAGAGLFSHAFRSEGFDLLYGIEIDPVAAATYRENVGHRLKVGDIIAADSPCKCDVLIAGPPCQGFSTLGKCDSRDPRNGLSLEVARWARETEALVVIVENVEAFLHAREWSLLAQRLQRLGYEVRAAVLNAYDFGVPQIRRRSFTIASRIGMPQVKSTGRNSVRTVREALRGLPPVPDGRHAHFAPEPSALALARMELIPQAGDKRDVMRVAPELAPPSWWRIPSQATDVWGRMEWDRPANTLRTCFQNASKGRYIHPEQHRVISLREAARLHSIEDSWMFRGRPTQIARQIGNSVPPRLGRALARSVRQLFG